MTRTFPGVRTDKASARLGLVIGSVIVLLSAALADPAIGAQPRPPQWVDVQRRVAMTDGRTADDVKQLALREALAEAVRRVAGVRVQGMQQATLGDSAGARIDRYEQVVRLDASGRATQWVVMREDWRSEVSALGSRPYYVLDLRVEVTPEVGAADPGFSLSLGAASTQLAVRGEEAARNDELIAIVRSSVDAFITLVSVAGDSVFVLSPNAVMSSVVSGSVGSIEIPDAGLRRLGVHFRVTLPPGVRGRTESLVAVATRRSVAPPGRPGVGEARDTGALTLAEFNHWLVGIPLHERAVAEVAIRVNRTP